MDKQIAILSIILLLSACRSQSTAAPTPSPIATLTPTFTATPTTQTPTPTPEPSHTPTPAPPPFSTLEVELDDLEGQQAGLRAEFSDDIGSLEDATRYWIEVKVDFDSENEIATIEGLARIRFINPSDESLEDIVLMLWPNDLQYQAEMVAGPLLVNDVLVEPVYGEGNLFLQAPLSPELPPGGIADISLPFKIEALGTIGEIGLKRFGISYSILAAPTFYPLVPRLIDGEWQKDPAPPVGDTTNSDIAFYTFTITSPEELELVTSGVEISTSPSEHGYQTKTFVSGPMRDIAFVLGPFENITREVDGVLLNGWVLPGHLDDGETMMKAAAQQFSLFSSLVGPYPYPELDLVDVPAGFGGIEYPGLVFIGTLGEFDVIDPTVHEVAHQWFYGLIGNDQLREPWLDEAVASYSQVLYYENFVGTGRASSLLSYNRSQLWNHPDPTLPIGLSVGEYDPPRDYVLFVYSKGALFIEQLRLELGDEAFAEFLKTYYENYTYGFATSKGFQDTAETVCSCDLADLFNLWVYAGGETHIP